MNRFLESSILGGAATGALMSRRWPSISSSYFPVAVGARLPPTNPGADTMSIWPKNPDVDINAIYTGSYADTTTPRHHRRTWGGTFFPTLAILALRRHVRDD